MIEYENLKKLNASFLEEFQYSFNNLLESGWYILGKNVSEFEANFARYLSVNHVIGVASGLDAMILGLRALDLKCGDEVIVPSNTYIASILAIIHAGLVPILVEPDINTYNIDPKKIINKISSRTKAIIVVHLYGKSCDMDPILDLCNRYDLRLLEDCAQSHGASYKGKKTGSFGDFGCFSFYPTKNLGALGDAGAITCNNQELADKVKELRNYGSTKKYYNVSVGFNSRLDEIQAGFLNVKLNYLNKINRHKVKLANLYHKYLDERFIKPIISDNFYDVYHIYNIRHKMRDKLRTYLLDNNIKTEIHYPVAPHKQLALKNYFKKKYPISEEIHNTTLSLPISYFHSAEDVFRVCEIINKF